jgi:hypothetical protein
LKTIPVVENKSILSQKKVFFLSLLFQHVSREAEKGHSNKEGGQKSESFSSFEITFFLQNNGHPKTEHS